MISRAVGNLKIGQGAAFTRVDTICDRQSDGQTGPQGKTMSPDPEWGRHSDKKCSNHKGRMLLESVF